MKKFYLCSVQSKKNPGQNETVLVMSDEISEFISSVLDPDCLIIFSECSFFNSKSSDEK